MTISESDVLILGGGCAGLSLAALLSRRGGPTVRVLESRQRYENDRTWCFWGPYDHGHTELVSARWSAWTFSTAQESSTHRVSGDLTYQMIAAEDFYDWALAAIAGAKNTSILLDTEVVDVESFADQVTVTTPNDRFTARRVIDTRPPALDPDGFAQTFAGAEVVSDEALFVPTTARLMTDMATDQHGFRFTYVLPMTKNRALVEETRFGRNADGQVLRAGLGDTLSSMAGGADLQVLRTEQGRIPMQTIRTVGQPRVVAAGTAAGAVRPSTGYAFARIQRWAAHGAAALAAGRPPVSHPADPAWRVAVDKLFLRVIDQRPELAPELFMAMANGVEPGTLVRFLSDAGGLRDFVQVAAALPKRPFLTELPAAVFAGAR